VERALYPFQIYNTKTSRNFCCASCKNVLLVMIWNFYYFYKHNTKFTRNQDIFQNSYFLKNDKQKKCHVLIQFYVFIITNCKKNCSKIHSYEKKIGEKKHVVIFYSHVGSLYLICTHYHQITNLHVSWVCSKSMQNLLFHRFVLFKHECCALFKHESHVHDLCVLNNV